jgi:hypothetical protein
MELWNLLSSNHYSICAYNDTLNWDISGEGEPDNELWKRNSYHAYTCGLITMGNSIGLTLEYLHPPSQEQQAKLTNSQVVNERVVSVCFVAFLELHRPEIENHAFGGAAGAVPLLEWRNDGEEWDTNVLWQLDDIVGWKRLIIEDAFETAEL